MQMLKIKSAMPCSPYAPQWDIPIGVSQWQEHKKIDIIKSFLLSKEQELLTKHKILDDARTGLSENDVTTRYGRYNLFDFADECPEINDLLNFLRDSWLSFIQQDVTEPYPLQILCWYNIIRKGQDIDVHRHAAGNSAYLSGNMHLDDYDTKTVYEYMEMPLTIPNIKGGLTIFPSYVEHGVAEYKGDKPRVSLAFDLYIYSPPWNLGCSNEVEHRPFMTEDMIKTING